MTPEATLLHELPWVSAQRAPHAPALYDGDVALSYAELSEAISTFASALATLKVPAQARVAIYLEKRLEAVMASFGATAHGAVFVPINPLLKADQVAYILRDCGVQVLLTTSERLRSLGRVLLDCPELKHVIVTGAQSPVENPTAHGVVHAWEALAQGPRERSHRVIDTDMAAILYTSGSTGQPKGVVLSHRNMVAGAKSVASYLENRASDVLLAALPLSFDAGFSQLTTAFHAGASVVLLNYLLPKDVVKAVVARRVTGLTAVPPLWIQLTQVSWPASVAEHMRYFANTGGRMPLDTLKTLRALLPTAQPYLMYGLTEAFRATYLPPEEVDRRPDSIGRAIPNSEIWVLRPDGSACAPHEPGELVQRGALVAQGYWNDPVKTAERFRPLPGRASGLVLPEMAVFSGDTVRQDEDGFLYFIGRADEMIKSSGYRISPSEVEEVLYASQQVGECAVFGAAHPTLGQAVMAVVTAREPATFNVSTLQSFCKDKLPTYMQPTYIHLQAEPLPRNANGKIDRKQLAASHQPNRPEGRP